MVPRRFPGFAWPYAQDVNVLDDTAVADSVVALKGCPTVYCSFTSAVVMVKTPVSAQVIYIEVWTIIDVHALIGAAGERRHGHIAIDKRQRGKILERAAVRVLHADQLRRQHRKARIPRHDNCEFKIKSGPCNNIKRQTAV